MSELDLTEAVDAAARAHYEATLGALYGGRLKPWDQLDDLERHQRRELVLHIVAAAAPLIVAQVCPCGCGGSRDGGAA